VNLADLLDRNVREQPQRLAYGFLLGAQQNVVSLSYAELDSRAKAISAALHGVGKSGDRALLLFPPTLEFAVAFWGCVYAGVVAVPVKPPHSAQNAVSVAAIMRDSGANIILTTAELLPRAHALLAPLHDRNLIAWLATDATGFADGRLTMARAQSDTPIHEVAYLQYTSGSTGRPRGVITTHANVIHNLQDLQRSLEFTRASVSVTWLPHFHDMGLVFGLLEPMLAGCSCFMMHPLSFLQRPARWLHAMSRHGGTHTAAPNFAYELCVSRVSEQERAGLDLLNWKVAAIGAEPIRAETLDRFAASYKAFGFSANAFCAGYGLAEATLKVTSDRGTGTPSTVFVDRRALEAGHAIYSASDTPAGARRLVGCGVPGVGTRVLIVEPDTRRRCASDGVGEIWLSGPAIAAGYWGQPTESEFTFGARLDAADVDTEDTWLGEPFLRTGDLGFVRGEELFVTGRIKDLIIVRGQNHYPEDIEWTAGWAHPALTPGGCAAFAVEIGAQEVVVLALEISNTSFAQAEAIRAEVRAAVAREHQLELHDLILVRRGALPKTTSSKLQRHACREAYLTERLDAWDEQTHGD
jgi:acyl-CoA synthetase (AMP-forming)/AMP-acid ligase II